MNNELVALSAPSLDSLTTALRSGRLAPPYHDAALSRLVAGSQQHAAATLLAALECEGFTPAQAAVLLETVAAERRRMHDAAPRVDVVTTGPSPTTSGQTTAVAVRELFSLASESVLLAGYAIRQGDRVFATLAQRMDADESLAVRFFLEVKRADHDTTQASLVISRFVEKFKTTDWPGQRLPQIFCDPRSVAEERPIRSSLHAKCVVVDQTHAFVSSANFTEAGHFRNIEVGVRLEDEATARRLTDHFELLVESNDLERVL